MQYNSIICLKKRPEPRQFFQFPLHVGAENIIFDFFFVRDEQGSNSNQINFAGDIEYEEFTEAQDLRIIKNHLDYYGDFRWPSQIVRQKRDMLTPAIEAMVPNLASILKQAFAANCGLVAFGD